MGMNDYREITVILNTRPKPKQSCRFTKDGRTYKKKEILNVETMIKTELMLQLPSGFKPLGGAIMVKSLDFVYKRPKSHYRSGKYSHLLKANAPFYKTTRPDLTDNLPKLLFDTFNGIVIEDDSKIVHICNSSKIYGDEDKIVVRLIEIDPTKEIECHQLE